MNKLFIFLALFTLLACIAVFFKVDASGFAAPSGRFNESDLPASGFKNPNINQPVNTMQLLPDGRIFIAGAFTTVGGLAATALLS